LGAARLRLYRFHILPVIGGVLAASASLAFAYSLLNSAALSYLGLGGPPGIPDWGAMLYEGRQAFRAAPWLGLAPGAAITIFIWLANRSADVLAQNRH
jgi:ABC-type dipeptide/oligopeptide/nickel transport system permease subunit